MRAISFYHKDTGLLNGNQMIVSDDDVLVANTPVDYIAIDGHFDSLSQRVDVASGEVIDYQPPAPSPDYEWNAETKRWQLAAAAQSKIDGNAASRAGIADLEASQHRAVRELALGMPGALDRLTKIDAEIAALRPQLQ